MTDKMFKKKALGIINKLVNNYIYNAEECSRMREGKPCKHCKAVLQAREFVKLVEEESK